MTGIAIRANGHFRPNELVINPNKMLPIKPPIQSKDDTQEPSSIVIGPDGNGLSSDVNKSMLGEDQPHVIP